MKNAAVMCTLIRAWSNFIAMVTINQPVVVDSHATDSTDELEVIQVVFIVHARVGADLQRVVITARAQGCTNIHTHTHPRTHIPCRVFKQAVVRAEHLVREQIEPFPVEGRGGPSLPTLVARLHGRTAITTNPGR